MSAYVCSMLVPVFIFVLCKYIFKRAWLNIPIYILLLGVSVFKEIYWYSLKMEFEIDFIDKFVRFFKYESVIVFWMVWFPSIISFAILNLICMYKYYLKRK